MKMWTIKVLVFIVCHIKLIGTQGFGSGADGKLRLCVVDGKGSYKRAIKFCPVLDEERAVVECVLGTDRLDCLRRMGKGTVDFAVLSPEDLIAARWANIEVLVTNELKSRPRKFERTIVAVVNRRILPEGSSSTRGVLQGSSLCHPGFGNEDDRGLTDTLAEYIESLVTERSCDANVSLAENRVKSLAQLFGRACRAGPWVMDRRRDEELKKKYPSLCALCANPKCAVEDRYWGTMGALGCLAESAGDVTWADLDNVLYYFGLQPKSKQYISGEQFAYLCRDGSWQPLTNNTNPCVWLQRPWPVVVAKRKAASSVRLLAASLTSEATPVDGHWPGALVALLEANQALPEPLAPPRAPLDYLSTAYGFREAYSRAGCQPSRHITMCTSTLLEKNKCDWLSEAGAVYGATPPLQCSLLARPGLGEAMAAVRNGDCDVVAAESDWLVKAKRDYSLTPLLHEITPIVEKMATVVAYVKDDAAISKMADLRGKRAAFPRFDGFAWHSVFSYLSKNEKMSCRRVADEYFEEICAPGIEMYNSSQETVDRYTKSCYKEDGKVLDGEVNALRALVEDRADVAFISMKTYHKYEAKQINEPWAQDLQKIIPICPEDNRKFCFIAWSNIGHIFASNNTTPMRRYEIINLFEQFDRLFGKHYPFHSAMFSIYSPFNHKRDVLFHNDTRSMASSDVLTSHPYDKIPLNFERTIKNDSCHLSDFIGGFGARSVADFRLVSLLFCLVYCANVDIRT